MERKHIAITAAVAAAAVILVGGIGLACTGLLNGEPDKATPENCPDGKVIPCAPEDGTEIIYDASDPRLKEWLPNYEIRKEA